MVGRSVIVGGGGFGRELVSWLADCADAGLVPPVAGVIDDAEDALTGFGTEAVRLGSIADFSPERDDQLFMAIGSPETKRRVDEQLRARGARFGTMVHPSVVIARSARLEEGVVLCPQALVSADVKIGRLGIVNALSSVGHDAVMGDHCTLSAHVDLTGGVVLGREVLVGSGAKILPHVRVGDGAVVGAGAVVYRNVPAGASVYSAPAKLLKKG